MKNNISSEKINNVTTLTKRRNGYWLYDENRGMNLAMRAKDEKSALVFALEYYQGRLVEVERENAGLHKHIDIFLEGLQFLDEE